MEGIQIFWLVLVIAAAVIEGATTQLVSVWFAVGALAALVASLITDSVIIQLVVFIVVTVAALIATRPLAKKITKFHKTKTNSDRNIGQTAVVVSEINNTLGSGQVTVDGKIWTARSLDGNIIPKDSRVIVEKIEGVKLIVSPSEDSNEK